MSTYRGWKKSCTTERMVETLQVTEWTTFPGAFSENGWSGSPLSQVRTKGSHPKSEGVKYTWQLGFHGDLLMV